MHLRCSFLRFTFLFLVALTYVWSESQEEQVQKWATTFGTELWTLGKLATKSEEIKSKYSFLNAKIERKNPEELLKEMVTSISRMMDRKMDAIKCIAQKAEDEAEFFEYSNSSEPFQYYSSKYSPVVEGEATEVELHEILRGNKDMYKNMSLKNDSHFYNLYVNTNHSSVHVPTNVYDRHKDAQIAIQWSEVLDEVFTQNYNSDPALSWQYFGSSSGVMRHYPAMRWIAPAGIDVFDCRIRTWFIEAATCTKDIVILLDNSGSMQGMGKHIAGFTVKSILETLSNNDYINILSYNVTSKFVVPCFEDMLVPATKENIAVLNEAVEKLVPDEKSNIIGALEKTFLLLKKYREKRNCAQGAASCNQAIMLITDGVPGELRKVIEKHNLLNNGSNIPVRIFTYSVGQEVTNAEQLIEMSCANRGYYSHEQALEQVTYSVFQYIPVIARPLVLVGADPKSWTHAYTDITYDDSKDDQINEPYRLLTSVAIPAFDRKANQKNGTTSAVLLGVAGTDVPIDDIRKLTLPYKIGVSGYAFIVSNNGYLLMHPDLRPVYRKILKKNYNSVDVTEVEQHEQPGDDGSQPRVILPLEQSTVRRLRLALVNGTNGKLHNVSLKYHYDNMRRVSREFYDYYYAPIMNTPFSIGLGLPRVYGKYSLRVDDEIKKNKHTNTNITSFFEGFNWRIHPKWVYCRYHYLEGHEFKKPEEELLHFLKKIDDKYPNFDWQLQYEAYGNDEEENLNETRCDSKDRTTLKDDDYYCDKQLMQRLVFDAKNTKEAYKGNFSFNSDRDKKLFRTYNTTLRFVATMSGLTRWGYIFEEHKNSSTIRNFGNLHAKAIDEIWYKSAVLQHQIDNKAFVYSVPFDVGDNPDTLVTGSYAIFPSDAGMEAPGSVVGFQFSHAALRKRLENVGNKASGSCSRCMTCMDDHLDCYVIDSSGYVVVSYNNSNTGRFLGEVQPDVMSSMLEENIFERLTIYDYQAVCFYQDKDELEEGKNEKQKCECPKTNNTNAAEKCECYNSTTMKPAVNYSDPCYEGPIPLETVDTTTDNPANASEIFNESETAKEAEEEVEEERHCPCDKRIDLFMLRQNVSDHPKKIQGNKTYYIKKIPYSNLIFVAVVNSSLPSRTAPFSTKPEEVYCGKETEELHCQKLNLNEFGRRHLSGCYNEHPDEHMIKDCGKGTRIQVNLVLLFVNILVVLLGCYFK